MDIERAKKIYDDMIAEEANADSIEELLEELTRDEGLLEELCLRLDIGHETVLNEINVALELC